MTSLNSSPVARRIFHGVASGFGLTVVSVLVAVIQLRLAIDFLSKDLAGIWMLFLTFATYVAFLDLGFSPTLSREIGFVLGRNAEKKLQYKSIADLLRTTLRVFQVLAVIVFILGLIGGLTFLWTISSPETHAQIGWAWLIFMVGAVANVIGGAAFASLYGMGDVATERVLRAIFQMVWLVLSYVALIKGFGLPGLAGAWSVQNLLARIVALFVLYRRYPWLRSVQGSASKVIFWKMAGPSMRWAITGLGTILILQSSNIIIAATLGPASIPAYEAVTRIVMTMMMLSLFIVTSSTPFLSAAYAAGDHAGVERLIMRNVRISVSAVCVLGAFVAVFCDRIIAIWLGPEYFPGWPVVWTLLIMVVLETHHVALAAATMATGRVVFAQAALLAGALNIGIALLLVKDYGLWGIALAIMFAQLMTNNWYAPYVTFKLFRLPRGLYARQIGLTLPILFVLCLGVDILCREFIPFEGMVGLAASLLVALVIAGILVLFIVLDSEERRSFVQLLRSPISIS